MVGLTIGAILIGAASFLIVNSLRSNASLERSQKGSQVAQELLDKIRSWGGANWFNIYNLSKGSDNKYFLNASSTELSVVAGEESILLDDITSGLIAHWKLDESTSTAAYDSTGGNKNGILIGSPARATSSCRIGPCLNFTGANYISIGTTTNLDYVDFSASVWAKSPTNSTSSVDYPIHVTNLIGKGNWNETNNWMIGYRSTGSTPATNIAFAYGVGYSSGPRYSVNNYDLSQWHMFTGVVTSTTQYLYLDGVLVDSRSLSHGTIVTDDDFQIARSSYISRFFRGLIDDVRIYNRALSADEIRQLYQSSIYTRNFYVENVCRSTGATGEIVSAGGACAGGSADDPSTQKITVSVSWPTGVTTTQLTLTDYLTRWKNAIFEQSDWSGGVDSSGSYSGFANVYSSTTNTDTSAGGVILDLP